MTRQEIHSWVLLHLWRCWMLESDCSFVGCESGGPSPWWTNNSVGHLSWMSCSLQLSAPPGGSRLTSTAFHFVTTSRVTFELPLNSLTPSADLSKICCFLSFVYSFIDLIIHLPFLYCLSFSIVFQLIYGARSSPTHTRPWSRLCPSHLTPPPLLPPASPLPLSPPPSPLQHRPHLSSFVRLSLPLFGFSTFHLNFEHTDQRHWGGAGW